MVILISRSWSKFTNGDPKFHDRDPKFMMVILIFTIVIQVHNGDP